LSLQKATKAVRAESGVINDAVVLLDRQEGGKEKLAQNGVKLHALLNVTEVAKTLQELGAIDDEQFRTILKQVKKSQKQEN
jgi:orotate phosphoribosyltransferase